MIAQGQDVEYALDMRHRRALSCFESYRGEKNLKETKAYLLKRGYNNDSIDNHIRGMCELYERRTMFPDPEYFRIDADLWDSYKKDIFNLEKDGCLLYKKTMRERVNFACEKVIGLSLDAYIREYASDEGFQIPAVLQEVVKYYMQMIVECQKHEIYEPYIPEVLTMIQFGKVFTTKLGDGVEATIGHSEINSPYSYLYMLSNVMTENYKLFTLPPSNMFGGERLVMKFDPRLLIIETEWRREFEKHQRYSSEQRDLAAIIEAAKGFLTV